MTAKIIRMVTKDSLRLDGLLWLPSDKAGSPRPSHKRRLDKNLAFARTSGACIIHVHGTSSDFYRTEYFEAMSEGYTSAGWAFLTFNNRGSGTEYAFKTVVDGKIGKSVAIGSKNEIFEDCLIDIQTAVDFALAQGFSEIVLQGHSYGCNKVVFYAIEKGFRGKVVLLAPCDVADVNRNSRKGREKNWQSREPKNLDLFRYRDKKVHPRVRELLNDILIQIGTEDACIDQPPAECVDYLVRAFESAKVTADIIEGADHNYVGCDGELVRNILGWL